MDKDTAHKLDEASPSVEKTIKDPNFVLVLKKDDAADAMLRRTQFKRADGLLSFIMSDIASRMIGDGADAVANFASDMSINISDEGSVFGTEITPEYKRDKQLAMMLAKRYLDDIKKMIRTNGDFAMSIMKKMSRVSDMIILESLILRQKHIHGRVAYILLYFSEQIYESDYFECFLPLISKVFEAFACKTLQFNVIESLSIVIGNKLVV